MAATGYRNQLVCGTTVHQYFERMSMVRNLHGSNDSFPWVAHMGVPKLPHLEMFCSTHDMHLETAVLLLVHGNII